MTGEIRTKTFVTWIMMLTMDRLTMTVTKGIMTTALSKSSKAKELESGDFKNDTEHPIIISYVYKQTYQVYESYRSFCVHSVGIQKGTYTFCL